MQRIAPTLLATTLGIALACDVVRAEVPPRIAAMVPLLDAPELAVRERAMNDLLDPELGVTFDQIESLITPDLSPEQRVRLTMLARERFRTTPRGALGIQWNANQDREVPGLVISEVKDGFDARTKLRAGDRIIDVDGVQIIQSDDVRAAILSHAPGDEMSVIVERDGEIVETRVRLGDQTALGQGALPEMSYYLERAFRLRTSRWPAPSEQRVISTGLNDADWIAPGDGASQSDARTQQLRVALERLAAPAVLPGGRARDGSDRLDLLAGADTWQLAMNEQQGQPFLRASDPETLRRRADLSMLLNDVNMRVMHLEQARKASPDQDELRTILDERARLDALRARLASELSRLDRAATAELRIQQLEP
ncbi:MAG: PDZ domain-containing protein [Phycisphaerales bacterium]|jgi:hypothetical protein|nr:PDZ domain-containing protein [Phycisphaerales bacterium]